MSTTFAIGDTVRVRGLRGVYRILDFHLVNGEAVLYGGTWTRQLTRYVTTDRLLPARDGDTVPGARR